jgi:phytanoyl-CoA hydroxylase
MALTADQVERYRAEGFLVLEGFAPASACDRLRARMEELLAGLDVEGVRTVFSTDDQRHARDGWFLESGDKVRFFFEPGAFDAEGRLRQAKELSINKVGHALHDLDPTFDAFSRDPRVEAVARAIGLEEALLLQSMYIFKQPRIGGEVTCHQDATFLYTDPISVVGFWFALEDATIENGCLWAQPGGHRGPLRQRFEREGGDADGTRFVALDPTPLPAGGSEGLVPLETPAGTLVVLHGLLPHWSGPNRSATSRHAYSVHCIEAGARYPAENWLRRGPDLPLRGF